MGKVLAFPTKTVPHMRGPARCLSCAHRWEAVTPEGVITGLECPACGLWHGVLEGQVEPESIRWVCQCGCDLFYMLNYGCQCLMCGVLQKGF